MAGRKSAIYGAMVDARGNAKPVEVEAMPMVRDRGGYDPSKLDPVIEKLIRNAEAGASLLDQYTPMLGTLMERLQKELTTLLEALPEVKVQKEGEAQPPMISPMVDIALTLANRVSAILERINKMTMQSVKSKDDATRLHAFLMGGDDDDQDGLKALGENQLRRMVIEAATGFHRPESEDQ